MAPKTSSPKSVVRGKQQKKGSLTKSMSEKKPASNTNKISKSQPGKCSYVIRPPHNLSEGLLENVAEGITMVEDTKDVLGSEKDAVETIEAGEYGLEKYKIEEYETNFNVLDVEYDKYNTNAVSSFKNNYEDFDTKNNYEDFDTKNNYEDFDTKNNYEDFDTKNNYEEFDTKNKYEGFNTKNNYEDFNTKNNYEDFNTKGFNTKNNYEEFNTKNKYEGFSTKNNYEDFNTKELEDDLMGFKERMLPMKTSEEYQMVQDMNKARYGIEDEAFGDGSYKGHLDVYGLKGLRVDGQTPGYETYKQTDQYPNLDVTVLSFASWCCESRENDRIGHQSLLRELNTIRNDITDNNNDLSEFKRSCVSVQQHMQTIMVQLREQLNQVYAEIAHANRAALASDRGLHEKTQQLNEHMCRNVQTFAMLKESATASQRSVEQAISETYLAIDEMTKEVNGCKQMTSGLSEKCRERVEANFEKLTKTSDETTQLARSQREQVTRLGENRDKVAQSVNTMVAEFNTYKNQAEQQAKSVNNQLFVVNSLLKKGSPANPPETSPWNKSLYAHA